MPRKDNVFVLDFVNGADDIQAAFQPYYTSTILSESTDPNILYDLKRDLLNAGVFSMESVTQHYSLLIHKNDANQQWWQGYSTKRLISFKNWTRMTKMNSAAR